MKKYLQITLVLGAFFLLVFVKDMRGQDDGQRVIGGISQNPTASPTPSPTLPVQSTQTPVTGTPPPTQIPTATPSPTPALVGKYKNGTYDGSVEDAFYGNMQVRVIITAGRINDIQPLQYPNDNRTSLYINSQAFPMLRDEALKAQSDQIDMISGASDSSPAFARSLATALSKAQ